LFQVVFLKQILHRMRKKSLEKRNAPKQTYIRMLLSLDISLHSCKIHLKIMVAFLEIIIILVLILTNGFFSMAEIAIVSARKVRLQQRVDDGDWKAKIALKLADDPGRFLSTVQIWITLVGILAGTFGGATIAKQIDLWLQVVPWLAAYGEMIGVIVVVVVITYFTLVFGELVPKRLAIQNAEGVAVRVAGFMDSVARIASPLVSVLSASTNIIVRILGVKADQQPAVTDEDIKSLLALGTQAGVFQEAEQHMVAGVFRLADWDVGNLITPRTEVVWLDLDDPLADNHRKIIESTHSQFPVARGSLDNVLGIVHTKDLLVQQLKGQPLNLECLMIEPIVVPESAPALVVLERFEDSPLKMALVIDEFGGLQGLVTINDILGAIVGETVISNQPSEDSIVRREDGSWLMDGMLSIDEFKDFLDLDELPDEKIADYQTLGGFIMSSLGRIPEPADHFEWGEYTFEVVDMDGFRVDKVLVKASAGKKDK
jgi:putative hemolysin